MATDCTCSSSSFEIRDDENLSATLQQVRDEFLVWRAVPKFNRLESTIMLPVRDEQTGEIKYWLRGQTKNVSTTAYPASCVKLAYMAHAIAKCEDDYSNPFCFDAHVRPMVVYSDNFETGVVVDWLSGVPNVFSPNQSISFDDWLYKRQGTERFLSSKLLLGNQRIVSKTYPTNSGDSPYGYEKRAREQVGMNQMQACCASLLLLETLHGKNSIFKNQVAASQYAKSVLFHRRNDGYSAYNGGLAPGTLSYNKIGLAYDTLEDIHYMILPNGQDLIFTSFSNAFQRPTDAAALGAYVERALNAFKLNAKGMPPRVYITAESGGYTLLGNWNRGTTYSDSFGNLILSAASSSSSSLLIAFNAPEEGLYEVSLYIPTFSNAASSASWTIQHEYGTDAGTFRPRDFSTWVSLGDYYFAKGVNKNALVIKPSSTGDAQVTFNVARFTKYPYCNGSPGNACPEKMKKKLTSNKY